MADIEKLKLEVEALEQQLRQKRNELYAARTVALPFRVGDIIRTTQSSYSIPAGTECKVVGVANAELKWPRIVRRVASGAWGKRERSIYHNGFEVIGSATS